MTEFKEKNNDAERIIADLKISFKKPKRLKTIKNNNSRKESKN